MRGSFYLLIQMGMLVVPAVAWGHPIEHVFDVYRNGAKIGQHAVFVSDQGTDVRTRVDVDLAVKIAYITVFRYAHDVDVVTRNGIIQMVSSTTDMNGKPSAVQAERNGTELKIDGPSGKLSARGLILPTTYWDPATVRVNQLLDTQDGRIFKVNSTLVGAEDIIARGRKIAANKYEMRGDLNIDLWYTDRGDWVKLAFDLDGAAYDYVMVESAN